MKAWACGSCRWYRGGRCFFLPPLSYWSQIHGELGTRPLTNQEDFCSEWQDEELYR